MFQNAQVMIHVVREGRGARVVAEVRGGHHRTIWMSDLFGAPQGHTDLSQVCLAHQLGDRQFAIDAGDTVFAPQTKALLSRAVLLARRHMSLAESTRQRHRRRLGRSIDLVMALRPENRRGPRLRKRYGEVRGDLFTSAVRPRPTISGGRELRLAGTYRKVTNGFDPIGAQICSLPSAPSPARPHAPPSAPPRPSETRRADAPDPLQDEQML